MLDDLDTIDVLVTIPRKRAISHHGVLGTLIRVVDRDDHRVVVLDRLTELKRCQIVDIELDCSLCDFLVSSSTHTKIVDVVFTVGSVEHLWGIVRVFLLRHAHVNADVRIAKRIILERDAQLVVLAHPRFDTFLAE